MNRLIALLLVSAVFVTAAAVSTGAAPDGTKRAYFRYDSHESKLSVKDITKFELRNSVIVVETSPKSIERLKKTKGLKFIDYDRVYRVLNSYQMLLDEPLPGAESGEARECNLTGLPFNDTIFNPPHARNGMGWGIRAMYNDPNLTNTSGGAGVRVAVLDTGANTSHLDITGRIAYCVDFTTNTPTCDDQSHVSHGTGVASVIAANAGKDEKGMWGVAPEADLYIIKVCRNTTAPVSGKPEDACDESAIIRGIDEAVARGVNIISMSFGGDDMSSVMAEALDNAYNNNILLVAAAGNDGPAENSILYPAAYVKVMATGAIDRFYKPATFSGGGATARGLNDGDYVIEEREIEVAAPGLNVLAAGKNTTTFNSGCYAWRSGTSFSAPHVSGLAAKIWDGNALSVRTKIQNSAKLWDLNETGDDRITGFGLPTVNIPVWDLEVRNLYLSTKSDLTPGGTIIISFDLLNNGLTPAYNASINIDKGSGDSIDFVVPRVNPGQRISMFFNWAYSQPGTYNVVVTASPYRFVTETDDANNQKTIIVEIG